jgi:hypothetical protein
LIRLGLGLIAKQVEQYAGHAKRKANDSLTHELPPAFLLPTTFRVLLMSFAHCHLMTLSALASTFGGIVRPIFDKQSPKSEYRNPKQIENSNSEIQNPKRAGLNFLHLVI